MLKIAKSLKYSQLESIVEEHFFNTEYQQLDFFADS
jgi:hypothetical protein